MPTLLAACDSRADVFAMLTPPETRELKDHAPHVLAGMLAASVEVLLATQLAMVPLDRLVALLVSSWGMDADVAEAALVAGSGLAEAAGPPARGALMASLALIARIVPLLYEDGRDELASRILWRARFGTPLDGVRSSGESDGGRGSSEEAGIPGVLDDSDWVEPPVPFGVVLIHALLAAAFVPGLGAPACAEVEAEAYTAWLEACGPAAGPDADATVEAVGEALAWGNGLAAEADEVLELRRGVLDAVLALSSASLYTSSSALFHVENLVLRQLASPHAGRLTRELVVSVYNVVACRGPALTGSWSLGSLVTSAQLTQMSASPERAMLRAGMGMLALLLGYLPREDVAAVHGPDAEVGVHSGAADPVRHNQVRKEASRVLAGDAQLADALLASLVNIVHVSAWCGLGEWTMFEQALFLLWHSLEASPPLALRLVEASTTVCALVEALASLLLAARSHVDHHGLIHVGAFVLLRLSAERGFGVALNTPYAGELPLALPAFDGTYADVLVLTVHTLVLSRNSDIDRVRGTLFTLLVNVSPYLRGLSATAASLLVALVVGLAKPSRMLGSRAGPADVMLLLELFANMVQYQFDANGAVVHALLDAEAPLEVLAASIEPPVHPPVPQVAGSNAHFRAAWKDSMLIPLSIVLQTIKAMAPWVAEYVAATGNADPGAIRDLLQASTVVGLLPPPQPIMVRRYRRSERNDLWLARFLWSVLFLAADDPPMFMGSIIRLFRYFPKTSGF
ncbi:uncharacterized protein AMSG_00277 [Thecamonas trahens ATCC 50062]|uniref:Uncharacterized protein n=1 Tax=Thecamonas trahens ATCC 50062 TaxID=461836 RepID=A0A0L0D4D1_THETB|nr:hypothetical protein AMSG_00277 [Thecamonas trahens ATCC 50062]KNC46158.1 hypothetical protein AMSG_00277 [Thecamonas trahens ATCC 50062]|eukprot:XP_013763134.1 hypothetical protein AMSG_00277 [Thecamonas trahens ATCC 50062]